MQANWSLILNALLLVGVVIAIGRVMKARRTSLVPENLQPSLGQIDNKPFDDIIAVRRVNCEPEEQVPENIVIKTTDSQHKAVAKKNQSLMMFLLAKENRQFAGYELLQTVLAAGLRYGEGHLFHRHQHISGQGPVLCSLAAATDSGVFDLHNIGAFSVRGLCLFMHTSNNPTIDAERFRIMHETAKQLRDGLDAYLLDERKKPLDKASLENYRRCLNVEESESLESN